MIDKITHFLKQLNSPTQTNSENKLSLEVACTVLLCEVMKADGILQEQEKNALSVFISNQFNIDEVDITNLIQTALKVSDDAIDFYQFTQKVNQHYSIEQRIEIVGYLWKLAYSDGKLAALEEHIIRKISDLLHLRQSEYIQTKLANTPAS